MDERARRIGLNEALFRSINEKIDGVNRDFGRITGTIDIVCECGEIRCAARIEIPLSEYEQLRRDPTHFAVLPGHEIAEVERTVSRCAGYDVVAKRAGEPAELAEATDPRER
jgi:hypothetical protein